ncbi:MAG: diversity-generating retroelement protein Avd, partial [Natronospirillum sp.]
PVVDRFPKKERWALCTQIKNCLYRLVRRTIQLQKSKDKKAHIFEVDIDLEMLRYLIRQAHAGRYLSHNRLRHASTLVGEIGKILGGMLRKCGVQP